MKLFTTRGRELVQFEPRVQGEVSLYTCGPTVYGRAHIGNMRSALLSDIVRRTFEYIGYCVVQVENITDFGHLVADADDTEDKMTVGLRREGLPLTMENMLLLASRYMQLFEADTKSMNMLTPTHLVRASDYVDEMREYVSTLLEKGIAYRTSDGVYFDTRAFGAYGALGGVAQSPDDAAEHARIPTNSDKRDPRDFALWKFNPDMGWDAPWGHGFPGWHIECTAMSTAKLGTSFDIHTGGIDHISIHHNNEIAQAEAANGPHTYARYWLHNEFITLNSEKFSKSLKNEITLADVVERGIQPLAYRYWLLTGHYRQSMNFTWEALGAARTAYERLDRIVRDAPDGGAINEAYRAQFQACIENDFDTPSALALVWEMTRDEALTPQDLRATVLDFDRVLGLGLGARVSVPAEVAVLVEQRARARAEGDYARSDVLRDEILKAGYIVRDTSSGQVVERA